jgi:transposase
MPKRKNHATSVQGQGGSDRLSGEKTIAELSSEFGAHQTLIHKGLLKAA